MSEMALFFYVGMPLCFIARYLRKVYIFLEKKGGESDAR